MFVISKLLWLIAEPANALILLLVGGVALVVSRQERWGRWLVLAAAAGMLLITLLPLPQWLAEPLEDCYPRPKLPAHVDGILVLGGGLDPGMLYWRGVTAHEWTEARVIEGVALALRFPNATLVFSGGLGSPRGKGSEARVASHIFDELGVPEHRVVLEEKSRNTWENFLFTRRLVHPKANETWILVTSAFHMPRAMGIAQHIHWKMIPWPAAYISTGHGWGEFDPRYSNKIMPLEAVIHEWLGLIAYRIEGRTDSLLPNASS